MGSELIEKQDGHEVIDFVKQIEAAYDKLNSLSSGALNERGSSVRT